MPLLIALAHQAVAILVLTLAILQAERITSRRAVAGIAAAVPVGQAG